MKLDVCGEWRKASRAPVALLVLAVAGCSAPQAAEFTAPANSAQLSPVVKLSSNESNASIEVYFNPKEITIDKSVVWQKHKNAEGDEPTLEFVAAESKTLSCELMFDTFEQKEDVRKQFEGPLDLMADVDPKLGRPPLLTFTWGGNLGSAFRGVIQSIGVKYTLFLPDGTPCRATVQLKMKQANRVSSKEPGGTKAIGCTSDVDCAVGSRCERGTCRY
jgi:hypothetical protein